MNFRGTRCCDVHTLANESVLAIPHRSSAQPEHWQRASARPTMTVTSYGPPAIKVGKHLRWRPASVIDWTQEHERSAR